MDSMEDSGFDSDPKQCDSGGIRAVGKTSKTRLPMIPQAQEAEVLIKERTVKALKKSELQKKLEKQREIAHRSHVVDHQPKLLSRSRLIVPTRREAAAGGAPLSLPGDTQPLVMLDTDESEDEYEISNIGPSTSKEITQQLIKDGYNLDLEPDDEDLDLIPPRPLNERFSCCEPLGYPCVIQ